MLDHRLHEVHGGRLSYQGCRQNMNLSAFFPGHVRVSFDVAHNHLEIDRPISWGDNPFWETTSTD